MVEGNNPQASGDGAAPMPDDLRYEREGQIIRAIMAFKHESEDAQWHRRNWNRKNWSAYLGQQDFSDKLEGQSTEFLPKVAVSVEQLASLIKRGLVQFGDYYSVDLDNELSDLVDGAQVRSLLNCFLNNLWQPNNRTIKFPTVISDAVKQALLKSLLILKVHGGVTKHKRFQFSAAAEPGENMATVESDEWRLRIDLLRFEDYYPDPTGNGLYEVHEVERDLKDVLSMAKMGIYDEAVVRQLIGTDHRRPEDEKLSEEERNQNQTVKPSFRKMVKIAEFWGTILNEDGTVAHENVVAAVANDRFLIRPPEPNPFWHGESPFVCAPLIRVPHSVFHKALFDHATDLNFAINEMFNLMLDGGLASVHGVKQLRLEDLEDPSQVSGGIRQGMTLAVKQTLPHNAKVLETVSEGDVPRDAMAVFEFLNREFTTAAMTNELKLGALPPKQVLATEILESSQSQNLMLDGIIADLENEAMSEVLRKAWLTILQNADKIPDEAFGGATDRRVAMMIMRAQPEERFAMFYSRCKFRVHGLSSTLTRALDFQKVMALLQAVTVNPMLFQAFMMDFSPKRTLRHLISTLNINPDKIRKSVEERKDMAQEMQRTAAANQMLNQGPQNAENRPGGVASGNGTGGDSTTASIQQNANPASGLIGNA